jgi:hypothetical protein
MHYSANRGLQLDYVSRGLRVWNTGAFTAVPPNVKLSEARSAASNTRGLPFFQLASPVYAERTTTRPVERGVGVQVPSMF